MLKRHLLSLALFLAAPATAHATMSDVSCDDSVRLMTQLTDRLGAERQGVGVRDPDTVLEIWVTQRSGDWMIVQSYANGTSCIVATGEHWQGSFLGPA